MKIKLTVRILFLVLGISFANEKLNSQVVNNPLAPYVIFSGKDGVGTTLIGSSITVNGVYPSPSGFKGAVGGVQRVETTGEATIKANIHSWDKVIITNSNTIQGNIAAAGTLGTVVSIGSNVNLTGNIDSKGNIVYQGGTFTGTANVSGGFFYFGNTLTPAGNSPVIPPQPSLPDPKPDLLTNSDYNSTKNITTNAEGDVFPITAGQPTSIFGVYNDVTFTGNKTLKLNGPGVYVFNNMLMTGNSNKIIFDFKGNTTDNFYVYIKGNADLGKMDASIIGVVGDASIVNNSASRTWIEVQGLGLGTSVPNASFIIANGAGGGSKLRSTVYATRAAISIGSGTGSGSTSLWGALYSKTSVSIKSGVTINYVPFDNCTPITANAGPDQIGASTCGHTIVTLAGNTPTVGTGTWTIISGTGGNITTPSSPTSTFTGTAGSTYTLRWAISNAPCTTSTDNVVITFNQLPSLVDADPTATDNASIPLDFTGHATLTGSTSTDVTSIIWTTSEGVFSNPAPPSPPNVLNITVGSAGIYTLTGTNAAGCTKSSSIEVTSRRGGVIGSELKSIFDNYPESFDPNDPFFTFTLNGGTTRYVTIDIIFFKQPGIDPAKTRDDIIALLSGPDYGLTNIIPSGISKFTITGDFPILNLLKLDAFNLTTSVYKLNYSRPYYRPFTTPFNNAVNIGPLNTSIIGIEPDDNLPYASEGDSTIRSNLVRKGYSQKDNQNNDVPLIGTGVKIGVISDSYRTIPDPTSPPQFPFYTYPESADATAGRLPTYPPGDLHISDFSDYFPGIRKTDEGRAMMEIAHRIAPGAELFFSTAVFTPGHFAATILDLAQNPNKKCKVIVDDVTYPTEPFLKDGIVAKAVNTVVTENKVLYFTAAGNFRNNAYASKYHGTTSVDFPDIGVHDFNFGNGPKDIYQKVKLKPGSYMFVLQWVDNFYSSDEIGGLPVGTQYDMNFYLSKTADGKGLIGYNRPNDEGDAIEFIPIIIPPGPDQEYNVIITNNTSTTAGPEWVKYIVYKNDIQFMESFPGQYASTISGQGNAEGAITIGAARYYHIPGHPLLEVENQNKLIDKYKVITNPLIDYENITKPLIENTSLFGSSVGGTVVNNESSPRLQPSLTGPDAGTTTVRLGPDYLIDDDISNFFGTSAAAPHVAAGVALILQGLYKFKGDIIADIMPADIKKLIQKTAVDMRPDNSTYNFDDPPDPANYDFVSGAGLLNVDAAMRTFAKPQPLEIRLIREDGKIACEEPIELTIIGENFSANTEVYMTEEGGTRQRILPQSLVTFVSPEKLIVTINSCVGNPLIEAFTPQTNGLIVADGGWSPGIRLFSKELIVETKDATKYYGQDNPFPNVKITLIDNGVSTKIYEGDIRAADAPTTAILATYGLDKTKLTLVATAAELYSSVNDLPIKVYREFDIDNTIDKDLLYDYRYRFISGSLKIKPMPLTVTPKNIPDTYVGNYIGNVTFDYIFNDPNVQPKNSTELKDAIKAFHETFLVRNALAVAKDGYLLSDNDLTNMSMMTTFRALKNSRKFKVENNKLVPETDPNSLVSQYLVDLNSKSIFEYKANTTPANFYEGYPGISKKALLGKTALETLEAQVNVIPNGGSSPTAVSLFNGSTAATLPSLFNGTGGLAPLYDGNYISIINGTLATTTIVDGKTVLQPIPNSPTIQYISGEDGGSLCYFNGSGGTSSTAVSLLNGTTTTITLLDGTSMPLASDNSYIKFANNDSAGLHIINGIGGASATLSILLNGVESPLANYKDLRVDDAGRLLNGGISSATAAPLYNGSFIALNGGTGGVGGLATLLNGGVNPDGTGGILINGGISSATAAPLFNGSGSSATIASLLNGNLSSTAASLLNNISFAFTNGTGTSPTIVSLFNGSGGGGSTNTNDNAVIVDEADVNPTVNPPISNYLGAMFGINMITGLNVGPQIIVPGILPNPNFVITYGLGHVKIIDDPNCKLVHTVSKSFSNTTKVPTTLWVNITTKVSSQLKADGQYLLFKGGSFALSSIDYKLDPNSSLTIPDGMIIARPESLVPVPKTHFDWDKKMWITEVPLNYPSTSDIFITGAIINSSEGFIKKNNNATTSVQGYFYSNTEGYTDQWTYSMAAYQYVQPQNPYFQLQNIDGVNDGGVVAVNGPVNGTTYRAGAPYGVIQNNLATLVSGGSGGGGNNYTGSTTSFDKLTACTTSGVNSRSSGSSVTTMVDSPADILLSPSIIIYPNPADNRINISFVPEISGNSRIVIYTMDGKKALELNNGNVETGKSYLRNVDVGKLPGGVYMVQLWSGNKVTVRKVVVSRHN